MVKAKILLVEDDKHMTFLIAENLQSNGYELCICHDGESGLKTFRREEFDLCILDIMLPRMDGFTLAKVIRNENERIPVIFLTARNVIDDKQEGFRLGGDDYITKPFNILELLLRIEAVLRRSGSDDDQSVSFEEKLIGSYSFNYLLRQLRKGEVTHNLSAKETELLNILFEHKNQLLPRQVILRRVWGNDNFFTAKSMDVYLTRIRKLISGDSTIKIQNVHGVGYRLIVKG